MYSRVYCNAIRFRFRFSISDSDEDKPYTCSDTNSKSISATIDQSTPSVVQVIVVQDKNGTATVVRIAFAPVSFYGGFDGDRKNVGHATVVVVLVDCDNIIRYRSYDERIILHQRSVMNCIFVKTYDLRVLLLHGR